MDQPLMKANGIQFFIHKNKATNMKAERMRVSGDVHEYSLLKLTDENAYKELAEFIGKCIRYNPKKSKSTPKLKTPITTRACEELFDDKQNFIPSKNQVLLISGYYAHRDAKGKIKDILFFIRTI